jgi:hypothetical protein
MAIFYFVILLFTIVNCNIWDNMFSQLKSPHFVIPSETKVELFRDNNKMMELLLSDSRNVLKVSLFDKDYTKLITNVSDIVDIYVNFTNATVSFDFSNDCYYKNFTILKSFTLKFFEESYDILTLFVNGNEFYEYYLTNPIKQNINKEETEIKKFLQEEKILFSENFLDEDSMVLFQVNKLSSLLEKIKLKYKDLNIDLTSKMTINMNFTNADFNRQHSCRLVNVKDE